MLSSKISPFETGTGIPVYQQQETGWTVSNKVDTYRMRRNPCNVEFKLPMEVDVISRVRSTTTSVHKVTSSEHHHANRHYELCQILRYLL